MKLFAQHGAQTGEKITEGLTQGLLDGAVFSPRDIALDTLRAKLDAMATNHPTAERLFDPQYYAVFLADNQDARLGYLAVALLLASGILAMPGVARAALAPLARRSICDGVNDGSGAAGARCEAARPCSVRIPAQASRGSSRSSPMAQPRNPSRS